MKHIPALLADNFAKGYNIKLLNENLCMGLSPAVQ
jgi:hypothetical protein